MKQLTCEMCGGTDLVKDGGIFICQTCGCKYSVEEAKKMMVEGTVDITGTVKIDRSSELDNFLKNADRSFEDGKYKEAYDLYSKVINIDPDNAHAILYRAVSSAWGSRLYDCRLNQLNTAVRRALKLKHEQVGDVKEYFLFANDATNKTSIVIGAISRMYIRNYNKRVRSSFSSKDDIAEAQQIMERENSNCSTVSSNIVAFIRIPVSDYSESFEGIWNSMETMIRNSKQYRSNAGLSYDSELDRKLDEIQNLRKATEDQWKKH